MTPAPSGASLLWRLLRGQRRAVLAGAASGAIWMTALAAVPFVLSKAVDAAVVRRDGPAAASWLAVFALLTVVQLAAGGARHWLACRLHYRTTSVVSTMLTERVHDPRGGVDESPGSLVTLVTSDAPRIGSVADLMCRGSGALTALVGTALVMVAMSPPLAAAVLAVIPTTMLASAPLLRPLERRSAAEQRARARVAAMAGDMIEGLRVLHGLGAVDAARSRFAATNDEARHHAVATGRLRAVWEALDVTVPGTLLTVTLLVGGGFVVDGRLSPGQLVGFLTAAQFLLTPVATLVEVGDVWTRGLASSRRLGELVDAAGPMGKPAKPDLPSAAAAGHSRQAALELTSVRSFDGTLDGCTFAVERGEAVGIVTSDDGAAQALADLLAGAVEPAGGCVRVEGRPTSGWRLDELRRRVVVEDGLGALITGSLRANVSFGRPDADIVAVQRALAVAGADEIAGRFPDGLDADVGEGGRRLSGGQRQRIALARALVVDPPILVVVEPTSAVDVLTEQAIVTRLLAARRCRSTTVVITTTPGFLAAADRVVLVDRGGVTAIGRHGELLATSHAYRRLVMPTHALAPWR